MKKKKASIHNKQNRLVRFRLKYSDFRNIASKHSFSIVTLILRWQKWCDILCGSSIAIIDMQIFFLLCQNLMEYIKILLLF